MTKSLADLRKEPPKARSERSMTVCLRADLTAEVQALAGELDTLPSPTKRDETGEPTGPPRRIGVGEHPRAAEIRGRLAELLDEMAEYEGELRLRAISDGEWRQWVDAHPARAEDEPGHRRDLEVAAGFCNADALIADLARYAHSWNGEELSEGDWPMLADSMAAADVKAAARTVALMHESRLDFPAWRSGLQDSLSRLNASASPETSASPRVGSSGGSRGKSSAATTKKATA